jgi:hypothetical protein
MNIYIFIYKTGSPSQRSEMEQTTRIIFHIIVFKRRGWMVLWHPENYQNTILPNMKKCLKHFNENRLKMNSTW